MTVTLQIAEVLLRNDVFINLEPFIFYYEQTHYHLIYARFGRW